MRKFTISLCAILFCISGYAQGAEVFKKQSFLDGSITSETLEVPQTNLQSNSYCTPLASGSSYRINSFLTTGGVQNVENLNSGFSNSGYGDFYSSHVVEQIKGGSIEFNAELSTGLGLRIWVDWNQDGLFDEAEEVAWFSSNFLQTQSGTIEVPTDAVVGETRMRISSSFLDNLGEADPCKTFFIWGEFEDYKFIVSEEDEAPEPEDPCDDKIIMECGVEYTADLVPNAGYWDNYNGTTLTYSGSEQVFEFTAPYAGSYTFILDQGSADADFFVMDACSNTANNLISPYWTGTSDEVMNLTAGQTIYVIADLYSSTSETTVSIQVECPMDPADCETMDVPYLLDFENATAPALPDCTFAENLGAGNDWITHTGSSYGFTGTYLRYKYNFSNPANTWFYTHGVNLEAGETYKISYDFGGGSNSYTESLKVAYGTAVESAAMTTVLADHPNIQTNTPTTNSVTFTVDETGVYYFGFHAYSSTNQFYLQVDNIEIIVDDGTTEPEPQDCSQGIPSFETVIDANGITIGEGYRVAEDFIVPAGTTFTMNQFTIDMNMSELPNDVIVYIHEDDGGYPGAIIETINTLHTSSEIVGSAFGDPIHHLVFELDTPIEFEEGTYWFSPTMSVPSGDTAWWATTDEASHGSLPKYSNDEGDTWSDSTSGTHMIFTVSGVCEGEAEPEPEPENPCDEKIIMECGVEYTADLVPNAGQWANYTGVTWTYNGSEQVFEFTADMTGDYEFILDQGAADADFMVMDACSNTANNLIGGYWTGSSDQTLFLTEGQTIYIIADLFSASTPSTLSIQVNCPSEPMLITCEDNFVDSNNLENGLFFGGDSNQRLAIDVIVGDEGFTVYGMDLNIFTDGNTELDFYFTIYEDESNLPGAVYNDNGFGNVYSTEYVGDAFGFDVYNYVVAFDTPVTFEANTKYWIEVETNGLAWEATEVNSFGSGLAFANDGVFGEWTSGGIDELVYSLVCEELGVSDLSSFDFAYYPNPVRDVLNITSQKAVESVEVYNLTGQKVMNESKVNQGQIDVSNLSAGTYVFRVTLEEGQVETFKIIKR